MSSNNSKANPKSAKKKKTMAELYPNLPFLPDLPDRPRYRPLADTVDHLRGRLKSLPKLANEIDIAIEDLGQEVIEINKIWAQARRSKKK